MSNLSTITAWMKAQVGTPETPKGSNNVIYNTHYYGHEVSGDAYPWCAAFDWAGFNACGLSNLFLGGEKTASVAYIADWAQRHGCWVTENYKEGDIVCFGTAHIGYCLSCQGQTVTTIEGNYGDRVAKVQRHISEISGAYRPDYGEDTPRIPAEPENPYVPTEPIIPENPTPDHVFVKGDLIKIIPGATDWKGVNFSPWVYNHNWFIKSVNGKRAVIDKDEDRRYNIMSGISTDSIILVKSKDETATEPVSEYTVQAGDTLWEIADNLLGSGAKYKLIQEANNLKTTTIYPGQKLVIPEVQ